MKQDLFLRVCQDTVLNTTENKKVSQKKKEEKRRKRKITNNKHPKKKYMIYTHHEHQKTPEKYIYMNLHLKYEKKDTMDKHIS